MRGTILVVLRGLRGLLLVCACLSVLPHGAPAEARDAPRPLRYSVDDVTVRPAGAGAWTVNMFLSVTDSVTGERCDIRFVRPFQFRGSDGAPDAGWTADKGVSDAASDAALVSLVNSTALGGGALYAAQMRSPYATFASIAGYGEGADCRGGYVDN